MRPTWFSISLSALLLIVACSRGGLPITTMAGSSSPTTAPVSPVSVMLLPFRAVGQNGENAWISQAIDEDLAHDLSRNSAIRVVRPSTTQPADGLAAARDAKADRLISGSYQVVDDQLRVTAEVVDVNQTQSVGQIKATGRVRDLFQLEDSLATQLWHILPQGDAQASANDFQVTSLEDYENNHPAPQAPIYEPPKTQADSPVVYDSFPDYGDSVYPYGSYGYGYPYGFGFPFIIIDSHGHHFYHHGGDYHGHGGNTTIGGLRSTEAAHVVSPQVQPVMPHFTPSPEMQSGGARFGGRR